MFGYYHRHTLMFQGVLEYCNRFFNVKGINGLHELYTRSLHQIRDRYLRSLVSKSIHRQTRVGLATSHGCGTVVQNNQHKTVFIMNRIYQGWYACMEADGWGHMKVSCSSWAGKILYNCIGAELAPRPGDITMSYADYYVLGSRKNHRAQYPKTLKKLLTLL